MPHQLIGNMVATNRNVEPVQETPWVMYTAEAPHATDTSAAYAQLQAVLSIAEDQDGAVAVTLSDTLYWRLGGPTQRFEFACADTTEAKTLAGQITLIPGGEQLGRAPLWFDPATAKSYASHLTFLITHFSPAVVDIYQDDAHQVQTQTAMLYWHRRHQWKQVFSGKYSKWHVFGPTLSARGFSPSAGNESHLMCAIKELSSDMHGTERVHQVLSSLHNLDALVYGSQGLSERWSKFILSLVCGVGIKRAVDVINGLPNSLIARLLVTPLPRNALPSGPYPYAGLDQVKAKAWSITLTTLCCGVGLLSGRCFMEMGTQFGFHALPVPELVQDELPFCLGLTGSPWIRRFLADCRLVGMYLAQLSEGRWSPRITTWNSLLRATHVWIINRDEAITYEPEWKCLTGNVDVEGLTFIPLASQLQLDEEGGRQEHCVASYSARCSAGTSFIYSVRRDSKSVRALATVEFRLASGRVMVNELRGPSNVRVPELLEVVNAAAKVIEQEMRWSQKG